MTRCRRRAEALAGLAAVAVAALGCGGLKRSFTCASSATCVNGAVAGTCEASGYCSFPDSGCATPPHRRFGQYSGAHANLCVGATDVAPGCALAVVAGGAHTCALATHGSVFCWGDNRLAQLGAATTAMQSATPLPVADGSKTALTGVSALAAGRGHTCAVVAGAPYCWGADDSGQIGDGSTGTGRAAPVKVRLLETIIAVATGGAHTCALGGDGETICWGDDGRGQVGTPAPPSPVLAPRGGFQPAARLCAGAAHTCALTSDGHVWCWGDNGSGQLGSAVSDSTYMATEIADLVVAEIVCGGAFTCGRTQDGAVYCWGDNRHGQAGASLPAAGGPTSLATPHMLPSLSGHVVGIAAGSDHACAVRADGGVQCWGANARHQLGAGGGDSDIPVDVRDASGLPLGGVMAVAAGGDHTCALGSDGNLACWGAGDGGQLGDGAARDATTPVTPALPCSP